MTSQHSQINILIRQGFALHQQLKFNEAQAIYKKILMVYPNHFDALQLIGALALQIRDYSQAVEYLSKAIKINPNHAICYSNHGNALQELKQLTAAIASYDKAISLRPDYAEAHHNRGNTLQELKQPSAAIASYNKAIRLRPDYAEAYYNCGNALQELKQPSAAITSYDKAISLRPDFAEAHHNRGNALQELKQLTAAITSYDKAISLRLDYAEAYYNRGNALQELKQLTAAITSYDKAISLRPDYAEAYTNCGNALQELKQLTAAIDRFDKAISLRPDLAEAHHNRGNALQELKQLSAAIASYDKAISLRPDYAEAYANRGNALRLEYSYIDALRSTGMSLKLKPQLSTALQNYASILAYLSDYTNVSKYSDQALSLATVTNSDVIWEARLYNWIYQPDLSAEEICAEHVKWGSQFSLLGKENFANHDRKNGRRLRIGYVSPDFRKHTCRFYFEPLFSRHDHTRFELFAYSNVLTEDDYTIRMKSHFDTWRNIADLSDQAAVELVKNDKIDILVDCCGHMMGTRLKIFSYKPAPIQVTWLGSAWTTGLPQIDYVLFDPYMAPQGTSASEKIVRLPNTWTAFRPGAQARSSSIKALPAAQNSLVTFGYSGRTERLNYRVLKVWGRILDKVPQSRLILDYPAFVDPKTQIYYKELLQSHGIDTKRVVMRNSENIFEGLGDIDVLLDSFPHSGGTMLFDAVWMGVPVLTLASKRPVGRIGTSLMTNLGLKEWIANSEQEYEDKAIRFANDIPNLAKLRSEMRSRMQNSPIMNEASFTQDVEQAFQTMWQTWINEIEGE